MGLASFHVAPTGAVSEASVFFGLVVYCTLLAVHAVEKARTRISLERAVPDDAKPAWFSIQAQRLFRALVVSDERDTMTTSFRTIVRGSLVVFGLAALAAQGANAATVTTIFSTGVLTNDPTTGNPATFSAVGAADAHYTVANIGQGTTPTTAPLASAFLLDPNGPPSIYGYPTGGTARNISPAANGIGTGNVNYDYRTTFDLTGFSTAGATLQGLTFADNQVAAIFLNGVNIGFTGPNSNALTQFTVNSGFAGGLNTLDFIVHNNADGQGNPEFTAFRADNLRLNANALPAVPEPGSVAMLVGLGVTGAGFLARRKRVGK